MANFMYTPEKERLMEGNANYLEGQDDIRAILVMTNSTAATDQDATNLSGAGDITTLDEFDGSGYTNHAGGGNPLDTQAVTQDTATNRAEFDAANEAFGALSASGTGRSILGMVLYRHVDGTTANDTVVAWIDTGGFPFPANGSTVTVTWNPNGIIQTT